MAVVQVDSCIKRSKADGWYFCTTAKRNAQFVETFGVLVQLQFPTLHARMNALGVNPTALFSVRHALRPMPRRAISADIQRLFACVTLDDRCVRCVCVVVTVRRAVWLQQWYSRFF